MKNRRKHPAHLIKIETVLFSAKGLPCSFLGIPGVRNLDRGARIYGEIVGYGFSADAHHITAPDPDGNGVLLALNNALDMADIKPEDVDHINMHGTSTPLGDIAETNSIKKVFRRSCLQHQPELDQVDDGAYAWERLERLNRSQHYLAIYHSMVPPTINQDNPDPECDLNYTPRTNLLSVI